MTTSINKPKTIAIFTAFYPPHLGGVERYTLKVVEQLQQTHRIIIITTNYDGNQSSFESDGNIEIIRLPVFSFFSNRFPILKKNRTFKALLQQLDIQSIDYYICNTRFYSTTILGLKSAKKHFKKAFVIDHGSNHISIGNALLDRLGAQLEHYLTYRVKSYLPYFYGVSYRVVEWLKHFQIQADGVFYNSIDYNAYELYQHTYYPEQYNDQIVISYAGRIIPEKGILLLLEAFRDIKERYPECRLLIAGDGKIKDSLVQEFQDSQISFLGKLDYSDVMGLMNISDIFVHPSCYPEGLPTAVLEAGIMKTAVIATDRGGTIEVINNSSLGLIIPETKAGVREALVQLLEDRTQIDMLKENIYHRVRSTFTWDVTCEKILSEIENKSKK